MTGAQEDGDGDPVALGTVDRASEGQLRLMDGDGNSLGGVRHEVVSVRGHERNLLMGAENRLGMGDTAGFRTSERVSDRRGMGARAEEDMADPLVVEDGDQLGRDRLHTCNRCFAGEIPDELLRGARLRH